MTPDEKASPGGEPAFDPATWTPDKPWPKGYYKPRGFSELPPNALNPGGDYRIFLWSLLAVGSQLLGLAAFALARRPTWGLLHDFGLMVPGWLLLPVSLLALPLLLYVVIMWEARVPVRHNLLLGLVRTLLLLLFFAVLIFARPLLQLGFAWVTWALRA